MQQSKGIIGFFLVMLLIVCAWQFSFYIPTNKVEKDADKFAQKAAMLASPETKEAVLKSARASYLDSMSSEVVSNVPLIGKSTYQELKSKQLALGLDLKGGMSVLLHVDLKDFLKSLSGNSTDPNFTKAFESASVLQKQSQADFIQLFVQEYEKVAGTGKLAALFSHSESIKNNITLESTDAQVQSVIRQKADETVGETYERLKTRIDKLGVVQPNVSLDKARDIIVVELPGIENPERARKFLEASANLEFWEVYRISDPTIAQGLQDADNVLKAIQLGQKVDSATAAKDSTKNGIRGPLFTVLSPNANNFSPSVIGTADKNKIATVNQMLATPEVQAKFPRDVVFSWSKDPIKDKNGKSLGIFELYALKKTAGKDGPALNGEVVTDAKAVPREKGGGDYEISLAMNPSGATAWGQLTTRCANDNQREVAIVLDSNVVSAPSVRTPILEGRSSISGSYGAQDAKDMASMLQVGKLPAHTEIIQENTVGPTLGAENIRASFLSLTIAFLSILVFMGIYYSTGGIISIIALFANLFFIVGMLTSKGTVLTLPGIAGIVLTMGMAVDANVIIYERIREEINSGKTMLEAVSVGFKKSFPAILDGNATAFIAAIVLAVFGLGPIKGFGTVLWIGIVFTLFTAFLLTHIIVDYWIGKGWKIKFFAPFSERAFKNINVDWMKLRKVAYIGSTLFILAGLGAYLTRGFELGVDFKGGYSYNVQFDKAVNVDQLRSSLKTAFDNAEPVVKAVSNSRTYNITTSYLVNDQSSAAQKQVTQRLFDAINSTVDGGQLNIDNFTKGVPTGTHIVSSTKVGPTVADDIKKSSLIAGLLGLLGIGLYIVVRFKRWQYSVGAIIATLHDALITLSVFALFHGVLPFSLEIDQALIAAVLTILGYSINDTVIVYDRIREYMRTATNKPMPQVINDAVNSVFSRTIITSFIMVMVLLILFIFGGSSIRGFAFALLIGIIAGTYSSVFIAAPIMMDLSKKLDLSDVKTVTPTVSEKAAPVVQKARATAKKVTQ